MDALIRKSIAVAGTPAGDEKAENRANPNPDGDGLIGMLMHGGVSGFRAGDRLVTHGARNFLGSFQRSGKTLAGFPDFFPGHVSGRSHQSVRVLGQLFDVILNCLCFFIHNLYLLYLNFAPADFLQR
jgi:hypothetical protein